MSRKWLRLIFVARFIDKGMARVAPIYFGNLLEVFGTGIKSLSGLEELWNLIVAGSYKQRGSW